MIWISAGLIAEEHKHLSWGWSLQIRWYIRFDHATLQRAWNKHIGRRTTICFFDLSIPALSLSVSLFFIFYKLKSIIWCFELIRCVRVCWWFWNCLNGSRLVGLSLVLFGLVDFVVVAFDVFLLLITTMRHFHYQHSTLVILPYSIIFLFLFFFCFGFTWILYTTVLLNSPVHRTSKKITVQLLFFVYCVTVFFFLNKLSLWTK